mmetsp:Transcript_8861/g.14522  ORF Transcript_8861/g.14522 Transcript_8861/m.14522 type:complete len:215 (-) Transcript_8861:216-860(-)|eukprot:CAMPEP_0184657016 /NCGR_PEP_ID=MMETSP0308-20130426/16906_1 /TAXON_ID=38269 /ORGANISM="Gloeochaete witrockiana, Strain SAG 46.84" /LENGTH=214 /DNA_ID=CAMNT_0027094369 /DNA_START=35 /DNA_END=679 /DNA_ORIENTATION=-
MDVILRRTLKPSKAVCYCPSKYLSEIKEGDHLAVLRSDTFFEEPFAYYHHGIVVSEESVIEFGPEGGDVALWGPGRIRLKKIKDFIGQSKEVHVVDYDEIPVGSSDQQARDRAIKLAIEELRQENAGPFRRYDLLLCNCEHFIMYCKTFEKYSKQAETVQKAIAKLGSAVFWFLLCTGHNILKIVIKDLIEYAREHPALVLLLLVALILKKGAN